MALNNAINAPYQENVSFSPSIEGSTSAGTGTYSTQVGYWTGIGNLIFINIELTCTDHDGTGDMLVTNLPFNNSDVANFTPELILNVENILLPANTVSIFGELTPGEDTVALQSIRSSGALVPIDMSVAGTVHLTGQYVRM